jgi:hypothetical protein
MEYAKFAPGTRHESQSDASHHSPGRIRRWHDRPASKRYERKLSREKPSPYDQCRQWAASQNQPSWFAAIAGATTGSEFYQTAGSPMPQVLR